MFFVLSLLPGLCMAQDAQTIINSLQKKYESITTLSADFTQEIQSKAYPKPQVSEGMVYFKKPGKMKWIYSSPINDELTSNGKKVWLYQPDLNQVIERPVDASTSGIGTDFLTGVGNIKKKFDVKSAEGKGDKYRLTLTPREAQQNIKKVVLEIDKTDFLVEKTIIEDHFGNETRVTLKNLKENAPQKDSFFEFKAPKGASVVKP